jgi:chromate transporter
MERPGVALSAEPAPLTARGWLWLNFKVGLLTFGTGSVMPLYQRALIRDTRMLSEEQFAETLSIAQLLPGPYLVSLTMQLGALLFGHVVGVLGVLAMCVPGAAWALLALLVIPIDRPEIQAVLAGFSVGAAVLIGDLVWQLRTGLYAYHVAGVALPRGKHVRRLAVAAGVAAMTIARLPLPTVTLVGIAAGLCAELWP